MVKGHESALPALGQANEAATRFPSLSSQEFTLICKVILRITSNVSEERKNCSELYTLPVHFLYILAVSIQIEEIRTPQNRASVISSVNTLFCQAKRQTQNMLFYLP